MMEKYTAKPISDDTLDKETYVQPKKTGPIARQKWEEIAEQVKNDAKLHENYTSTPRNPAPLQQLPAHCLVRDISVKHIVIG